jgi:methyl-accepting chemotaxis protein
LIQDGASGRSSAPRNLEGRSQRGDDSRERIRLQSQGAREYGLNSSRAPLDTLRTALDEGWSRDRFRDSTEFMGRKNSVNFRSSSDVANEQQDRIAAGRSRLDQLNQSRVAQGQSPLSTPSPVASSNPAGTTPGSSGGDSGAGDIAGGLKDAGSNLSKIPEALKEVTSVMNEVASSGKEAAGEMKSAASSIRSEIEKLKAEITNMKRNS